MKGTAIVATLCCSIVTMGMAYPSEMTQDFEAQTQFHLKAPNRGCVEVSHPVGGTVFRSYACDGANGEFQYFITH